MMAFWYHLAILFEALFILTAIDAGTRAGRFMLQDLLARSIRRCTARIAAGEPGCHRPVRGRLGYFLYQGVVDPLL